MSFTGINGLHHVTLLATDARTNNEFFTKILGLRRVKQTVNFDRPDIYHLYYGNEAGAPGTVITYFPFPDIAVGRRGVGEVARTCFSVPSGALHFWEKRFRDFDVQSAELCDLSGEKCLRFSGADGEDLSLVEVSDDQRKPWLFSDLTEDIAIRGLHSVSLNLNDTAAEAELLKLMGYVHTGSDLNVDRYEIPGESNNNTHRIDLCKNLEGAPAAQGAGSVHHVAFSVDNQAIQLEIREALVSNGYQVTPVVDRDYFRAIYFRTPGGVLFEIATDEPGFERDEERSELGSGLKLPEQHQHLREKLLKELMPLE